jgi:hypothetical protein
MISSPAVAYAMLRPAAVAPAVVARLASIVRHPAADAHAIDAALRAVAIGLVVEAVNQAGNQQRSRQHQTTNRPPGLLRRDHCFVQVEGCIGP